MNERLAFLAQTIVKAKKVMDKVENNTYTRGHVSRDSVKLDIDPNSLLEQAPPGAPIPHQPAVVPYNQFMSQPATPTPTPAATQSRLPKNILESFAKNPGMSAVMGHMGTPQAMNNFQMNQLAEATKQVSQPNNAAAKQRQILEQQAAAQAELDRQQSMFEAQQQRMLESQYAAQFNGGATPGFGSVGAMLGQQMGVQPQQFVQQPQYTQSQVTMPNIDQNYINYIIQETVKQTVKAVLEEVHKPQSLDENIQIKIGNKWFGGKIKTLKENVVKS